MTIRDGRNVVHDLGPRQLFGTIVSILSRDRFFAPMPEGASWHDEASRAWLRGIPRESRATHPAILRVRYREANPDHVRNLDRIRQQRRRDRQKASTAA